MLDESAFFDDRWEQDRIRHFYYLETPAYARLTSLSKHVIVKGHRGTGKTTLLRALDWRERMTNVHLRQVLGGQPFSDRIIGCFLQIKFLPVNQIDLWTANANRTTRLLIIGSYLRATWLYEACDALLKLQSELELPEYGRQLELLQPVDETLWSWANERLLGISRQQSNGTVSVRTVQALASGVMKYIRNAAAIDAPSPEAVIAQLDLSSFASVSAELFKSLIQIPRSVDGSDRWIFRICMDEGEFLSDGWASAVRSLIRETDFPVYLAVSVLNALGGEDVPSRAEASIDDRELVDLDDRPSDEMLALINGIVSARLREFGLKRTEFSAASFLGDPDLDRLVQHALFSSEGGDVSERITIRGYLESIGEIEAQGSGDGTLGRRQERLRDSAGYRKKKTAGYLRLLAEHGVSRPTYAGWRICIAMADNSVRDFIRFLRYAMDEWKSRSGRRHKNLEVFFSQSMLSIASQNSALAVLGQRKLESVPRYLVESTEARSLLDLFGVFVKSIDFSPNADLRRPNATRILVTVPLAGLRRGLIADPESFSDLLSQCVDYGYLADLRRESANQFSFRLNRSLARYYGFSYWKPQYQTRLEWKDVQRALDDPGRPPATWFQATRPRAIGGDSVGSTQLEFDWGQNER